MECVDEKYSGYLKEEIQKMVFEFNRMLEKEGGDVEIVVEYG